MIGNMNSFCKAMTDDAHPGYVKRPGNLWLVLVASLMALHVSCAVAQDKGDSVLKPPSPDLVERYPAGSIQSAETADAALEEVSRARSGVEASFAAEEQACYPKFFITSCVEQARERRRLALQPLRKIELEANTFKRRERVSKRDDAAAERQAKAQAEEAERAQIKKESKDLGPMQEQAAGDVQPNVQMTNSERSAQHEAKLDRLQQEESKNVEKRSANALAYEKKQQAAQERQKKVAERKAKKEAERRTKSASQSSAQ